MKPYNFGGMLSSGFKGINRKIILASALQLASVPVIMIPTMMSKRSVTEHVNYTIGDMMDFYYTQTQALEDSLYTAVEEIEEAITEARAEGEATALDIKESLEATIEANREITKHDIQEAKDELMKAILDVKEVQVQNTAELFNTLTHIVEHIDHVEDRLVTKLKGIEAKVDTNMDMTKKVYDLSDQVLDLMDQQTEFIDKGFIRREAYNDHIYNELLAIKEKDIDSNMTALLETLNELKVTVPTFEHHDESQLTKIAEMIDSLKAKVEAKANQTQGHNKFIVEKLYELESGIKTNTEGIKQVESAVSANGQEIAKTYDLANQALDLVDQQTDFIDKGMDRNEKYHDAIYNEILSMKDRGLTSRKRINQLRSEFRSDLENIQTGLADIGYDVVTSSPSDDIKNLNSKMTEVQNAQVQLGELMCISNKDRLNADTKIDLQLKSYILGQCQPHTEYAYGRN